MLLYRNPLKLQHRLGERVRACRLRANLSQVGLAARAGVTRSALQRLEREGKGNIEVLVKLACVLDGAEAVDELFPKAEETTMAELRARRANKSRVRGRGK